MPYGTKALSNRSANTDQETAVVANARDSETVCDVVSSLSINGGGETTGVTTFISEACEGVDVLGKHYSPSPGAIAQGEFQDLKEYFRRPRLVLGGSVSTGSRINTVMEQVDLVKLFTTYFPAGLTRLEGVEGVRFKIVFTLQVATTPYHQGVLCLNWQYNGAQSGGRLRAYCSESSTALPHVRLDLSSQTMVQLAIPFLAQTEYIDLADTAKIYGTLGLNNIIAIAAVASVAVPSYKIYVHLEELDLIGAAPRATTVVNLQSGKKLTPIAEENFNAAKPFSSGLSVASAALSWIAVRIPAISSLAGPAAFVTGAAAGIAKYFGYSKPQILEPMMRVVNLSTAGEQNVDQPSATTLVGPISENALKVGVGFSLSDVDEMSLAYVTGQFSQINYGLMQTSDAAGTVLYATNVSPSYFWFRAGSIAPYCNVDAPRYANTATVNSFYPSSVFFASSVFRYWRGGFKFRFTFGKTKYHGGRVMVSFVPNAVSSTGQPTDTYTTARGPEVVGVLAQPFGYSAIFDLRDSNVFEFEVPYVTNLPLTEFLRNTGSLTMTVIDPLQATTSVAAYTNFLVEVKAMSDYRLIMPTTPLYPPIDIFASSHVRKQSGKMLSTMNINTLEYTAGEDITSIKQLIMMPKAFNCGTVASNTRDTVSIPPWWFGQSLPDTVPAATVHPYWSMSWGGYFSQAYMYVRGGTDVHAYPTNAYAGGCAASLSYDSKTSNATRVPLGSPTNPSDVNKARVLTNNNNPLHCRLPAYQALCRLPVDVLGSGSWVPIFGNASANPSLTAVTTVPLNVIKFTLASFSTGNSTAYVQVSAADDAMLTHYIGPPFLALVTSSASTYYDPDSLSVPV